MYRLQVNSDCVCRVWDNLVVLSERAREGAKTGCLAMSCVWSIFQPLFAPLRPDTPTNGHERQGQAKVNGAEEWMVSGER